MKVLHITSEFSKKNFSISSLIIFITNQIYKKFNIPYSILVSFYDDKLFDKKNIVITHKKKWLDVLLQYKQLTSKIKDFDIIHIHGIWAPIQLLSILICNNKKKKFIIHPHGMLLPAALKSGGYSKFFFKIVFLFFFRFLIKNKIHFASITNQETKAISHFFPVSSIAEISNPIPFKKNTLNTSSKDKKLVYFGRIHPHKNLDIVIKAFKKAKIDEEWQFHIYGIIDDNKYLDQIKKLIVKSKQIQIKEPIFNYEKQKVLERAWLNILVSKSEVLSLSILEASSFNLPSLVNVDMEMKDIEDSVIKTKPLIDDIKSKIEEICQWSIHDRINRGSSIDANVKQKTSLDIILSKYNLLYDKISTQTEDLISKKETGFDILNKANLKFFFTTSAYMFNLMFSSFVVVLLVLFGHYSMAGELGLVVSFWVTISQIFSSNMRSIIISEQKKDYAIITMFYRLVFSIILIFISHFFIASFINFQYEELIILFSVLILVQWINEMNLVISEVKNQLSIFKFYTISNIILTLLSFYFLLNSNFLYFQYLITLYMLIILGSLYPYYLDLFKLITKVKLIDIYELNLKTTAFLSSFSLVFSSLAWRVMIYFIFDKSIAGIFFACFSIGSFPGTLFNSAIGPAFVKQKIKIGKNLKLVFLGIFFVILFILFDNFYKITQNTEINFFGREYFLFTVSASLIGSYFMSYAMFLRHKKIQSSTASRLNLFQKDILYGFLITFLIPILYFSNGMIGVSFSFLFASFIAFAIYKFSYSFKLT